MEDLTLTLQGKGEVIEDLVIGYKALIYPDKAPRYLFELRNPSPLYNCKWIWPRLPNEETSHEAVLMLMESVKTLKPVKMTIGNPIYKIENHGVCPVWEITGYFTI